MKFSAPGGGKLYPTLEPKVGDVFPSKSTGPKSYRAGTRYWLLVAITPGERSAASSVHHFLGLDADGNIVSTTSYGNHVMKERVRVGHCKDISSINLQIEWEPHER